MEHILIVKEMSLIAFYTLWRKRFFSSTKFVLVAMGIFTMFDNIKIIYKYG